MAVAGWWLALLAWLAGWLAGWLNGCGWLWLAVTGCGWLSGCLAADCLHLPAWLIGWLAGWLGSWLLAACLLDLAPVFGPIPSAHKVVTILDPVTTPE